MTDPAPYRDEKDTLVADNERLRAENAALRGPRRRGPAWWLAAALVVAGNLAAFAYAPGLVNARDDAHAYAGGLALLALLVVDVAFAVRWFAQGGR